MVQAKETKVTKFDNALDEARTKVRPEAMALPEGSVRKYNLDPPFVASVIRSAWPQIEPLLPSIAKLDGADAKLVKLVPTAVDALLLVDGKLPRKSSMPVRDLASAVEQRRELINAARPLADRGYIDSAILDRASTGTSYLDVGNGLLTVANELMEKWPKIHSKTVLEAAEVQSAQKAGYALIGSANAKPENEATLAELENERDRIATLVIDGWNEVRTALVWLRRKQGDANELAPSLYARGGGAKSKSDDSAEEGKADDSVKKGEANGAD